MASPYGISRSHSLDTAQLAGLLWASDQPDAETSTWQYKALTTDRHPRLRGGGIRTHNTSKREAANPRLRPRGHWDRPRQQSGRRRLWMVPSNSKIGLHTTLIYIPKHSILFLFNIVIYVFLFFCLFLCLLLCLYTFIVPTGTLRLPCLRFFRAFSSVVRQMPG